MNGFRRFVSIGSNQLRKGLTKAALLGASRFGFNLLSKEQTRAYLARYQLATHAGNSLILPLVKDAVDPTKTIFPQTEVTTAPSYVWRYERGNQRAILLRSGALMTDYTVLNTDYWSHDFFKNSLFQKKRGLYNSQTLIAPFSHYFDGDVFVGYYDFMFLIAAKLCRIKAALPESEWAEAVVAYPLVNTPYERELLTLLGFRADQILDSRQTAVQFERCVLGNHDNWAHQNKGDILGLKTQLEAGLAIQRTERNRIYISRNCRRRIKNEDELIRLLVRYNFRIIEDKPRSIAEQCTLYKNAEFIIGPHGASFTNLIWCEPGTHLLELFTARYAPNYFQYLAELLDLRYFAYSQQPVTTLDIKTIGDDIYVSIDDLERCLDKLLSDQAAA